MISVERIGEMQKLADDARLSGKRIGFVPTMGFLHEGHLSLIRLARQSSNLVVTSIFVNPTQFGPNEDFSRYPRDLARDRSMAESAGTDILFVPSTEEMYPVYPGTTVEPGRAASVLEGAVRPGHFRGVVTVVARLLNIVKPHVAVFGQKDAQQVVIVRQMMRDLQFDCGLVVGPTVREPDGLAMSSRNVYLSPEDRVQSTVLNRSLRLAEKLLREGERDPAVILSGMRRLIESQPSARIDYVSVNDPVTLEEISRPLSGEVLISLAVRFGATRLIDNCISTIS